MAHILEFSVTGLAGRKETYSQKLNRDVNIFFGLNGSGKTSLLKILHSAMRNSAEILENVPFETARVKIYSLDYHQEFTRTIDQRRIELSKSEQTDEVDLNAVVSGIFTITSGSEAHPLTPLQWTTKPKLPAKAKGSWSHRYLPTSRLYLGARRSERLLTHISEEQLDLYFARSVQDLWSTYSTEILSSVRRAQEDGLANILKAILSTRKNKQVVENVDLKTAYSRVQKFLQRQGSPDILGPLQRFEKQYLENPQLRSVVSDINEVEEKIEHAMAPREELQSLIQAMFSGSKEVHFRDRTIDIETKESVSIGLNTLSSGEKHLLRILIETLLAQNNSILVDEPEISMHVDWQRQLISAMEKLNPSAQIILATHSPEIMAEIDNSRIFRL